MPWPESRDPDLTADLAVGVVQARLELIKRNFDREAYTGRAQFLDVGLHDVVTLRSDGVIYRRAVLRRSARAGNPARGRSGNGLVANGYGRQVYGLPPTFTRHGW